MGAHGLLSLPMCVTELPFPLVRVSGSCQPPPRRQCGAVGPGGWLEASALVIREERL